MTRKRKQYTGEEKLPVETKIIVNNWFSQSWGNLLNKCCTFRGWTTVVAFAVPFAVYIMTLAPTVYNLDSAELTTAAATGGIMRATGYPLYLMLGYLWSKLPIGDVGYRMNLFSAFCGALTIAVTERILHRLSVGRWSALAALGLLAFGTYFWALSLIAEVYTLHTLLMAGLILALLLLDERVSPGRSALVGLLGGLSLTHHGAAILLIPGALWMVVPALWKRPRSWRCWAAMAGGGGLGLSPYLWLLFRYAARPAFNYAGSYDANAVFTPVNLHSLQGLMWLVSGQSFSNGILAFHGSALWAEGAQFGLWLWQAFLAVGIGPGLLGLVLAWRRSRRVGGMLTLMFIVSAGFYIDYQVSDKVTMFLPAYLIWAIWVGVGCAALLNWVGEDGHDRSSRVSTWVMRMVLVAAACFALAWNWRLVDLSDDWSTRERGEAILAVVDPNSLVLGWWDTVPVVEYLQLVEGQRPDVTCINRFLISGDDLADLVQASIEQRSVYVDDRPSGIARTIRDQPVPGIEDFHELTRRP